MSHICYAGGVRHGGGAAAPSSVVDRILLVLECCATSAHPLTLTDLARRTALPKATLHRVCRKLVTLGMLELLDGRYRIGTKLFALGGMNPWILRIRTKAMPTLHALVNSTGLATNLAVRVDERALLLEVVYSARTPPQRHLLGAELPLHATAPGKALLSGLSDEQLKSYLNAATLRPYTRATIVRPNVLQEQLDEVRRVGVALAFAEWSDMSGVAAPVVVDGEVLCSVAVAAKLSATELRQYCLPVQDAALRIARALADRPLSNVWRAPLWPAMASDQDTCGPAHSLTAECQNIAVSDGPWAYCRAAADSV